MARVMVALTGVVLGGLIAVFTSGCAGEEPVIPGAPDAAASADAGVGDGGGDGADAGGGEARSVQEARVLHPRMIDVFTGVIQRSCSPNPGVCHHDSNYPDLRTPGALAAMVDAPCNLEIPDPTAGWDACERTADVVRFDDGSGARIAWIERVGPGRWRLELAQAPVVSDAARVAFYTADGDVILEPLEEWRVLAARRVAEAVMEVSVSPDDGYVLDVIDTTLRTVLGGDPNRNGVWGAERPMRGRVIAAGDLERSYLWGRLTATVPGTRMPLANAPLSNADYAALACWIEQLGRGARAEATVAIDYDACVYARSPLDPAGP